MAVPEPIELLGVKINPVTQEQLVDALVDWALNGQGKRAYYVNAHALNLAFEQPTFRESLNSADLVYCDGFGVKWGAAFRGLHLPDRMTPPDWIDAFLGEIKSDATVFLLGDDPGVAAQCAEVMKERHPALKVAGTYHGFFDADASDEAVLIQRIRESGATVVLVGMGMPRQEYWIDRNLVALPGAVAVTVGALFRYYSGAQRRPPTWMTDHGLEWLGRLTSQPARMHRRYLVGNPLFVTRVLRDGAR